MRILLVCGEHQYGDHKRGAAYEYTNFLPALQQLGHEVIHFESFNKSIYADSADMNKQFLQTVQAVMPDVIFCVLLTYELWLETLILAKQISGAALLNWSTDDSWKYAEFSRLIAPVFDRYVTTYTDAITKAQHQGYTNFYLSQWAASAVNMQPPVLAKDCKFDVTFVGMAYGERKNWINALKQHGINVSCFGYGWDNGAVSATELYEIIRNSRISLNFAAGSKQWQGFRRVPGKHIIQAQQIKARVFEVPGAGGCLLSEFTPELERYYKLGQEITTFTDVNSCAAAIKHLLNNPAERDAIAAAGYQKTLQAHTYAQRFSTILSDLNKSTPSITSAELWDNFAHIEALHKSADIYAPIMRYYEKLCIAIFGVYRGRKAARRFVFELYWRLFGVKTYTAAGLPAKYFFHY